MSVRYYVFVRRGVETWYLGKRRLYSKSLNHARQYATLADATAESEAIAALLLPMNRGYSVGTMQRSGGKR